ncbi:hypothetical protein GCM10009562_38350 [Nocardioides aquaticus]
MIVAAGAVAGAVCLGLAPPSGAAEPHPEVVTTSSSPAMPRLVANGAVAQPHVDAFAALGGTMFAGGAFDRVEQGGRETARTHLMAFDRETGELSDRFTPSLAGGQVWALATDPATDSVYVGGKFTTVDGASRPVLAKLDASTGELDTRFRPRFKDGQVNDLELVATGGVTHLVVAGSTGRKVMSLNPATGRDDGWITTSVTDQLPGSWGTVTAHRVAVDPSRTHLAVTGNFRQVDGQARSKFFMLDLTPTSTSLSPWYYPGFAKRCATETPRRVANLQGIDFSPDGTSLTVAATGQIPEEKDDIWYHRLGDANRPDTSVCDGIGRFSLADPTKPEWINYTGGDSVWEVSDTGAAVYVAGHFKWLDNPDGYASIGTGDRTSGAPATRRSAIGAIDPTTGLANSWNPALGRTKIGGKVLLADAAGLWVGNDATTFAGAPRRGLASVPLPAPPVPDQVVWAVGESCEAGDPVSDERCAQVGRLIADDTETTAVLGLGGLQAPQGSLADYQQYYDPAMGNGPGLYARTLPVPGDEDYLTAGAAGYFDYWGARAGDRTGGYHATDAGAWTLVGANSNCPQIGGCAPKQPQGVFLRSELRDAASTCEVVFASRPALSDGVLGDQRFGQVLFNQSYSNGADLILSAHDTGYQRFAPRLPDGSTSASGLTSMVVGSGGRASTEWRTGPQRSVYRQNEQLGALRLVLSDGSWSSEFVSVSGEVLDTASGTCR